MESDELFEDRNDKHESFQRATSREHKELAKLKRPEKTVLAVFQAHPETEMCCWTVAEHCTLEQFNVRPPITTLCQKRYIRAIGRRLHPNSPKPITWYVLSQLPLPGMEEKP